MSTDVAGNRVELLSPALGADEVLDIAQAKPYGPWKEPYGRQIASLVEAVDGPQAQAKHLSDFDASKQLLGHGNLRPGLTMTARRIRKRAISAYTRPEGKSAAETARNRKKT
jgi:hypothetical protein